MHEMLPNLGKEISYKFKKLKWNKNQEIYVAYDN